MDRVVVIGDVGGHIAQLHWVLDSLGARDGLPAGTAVIQVGDLIDRGPASPGVLNLVRGLLQDQPERWIQLVGNHEAQYLPGGRLFTDERLTLEQAALLADWWESGAMNVAAAVRTREGDEYLVTHAGLTVACWQELGEPMTAASAAWLLNDRPGEILMRGGLTAVDRSAGPLWAEAGWELHEPWMEYYARGGFVPFGQIHGHSSIVDYANQSWRAPGRVRQRAAVDWRARQFRVRIGGRQFIGIDPKHGRAGAPQWQPLVLEDAEVVSLTTAGSVAG